MAVTCMTAWTGKLSLTQSKISQKPYNVFHINEQLMLHYPLTPLLTDNYPWEWVSVCKQLLQVAKWEGSVALALTRYDPALCV